MWAVNVHAGGRLLTRELDGSNAGAVVFTHHVTFEQMFYFLRLKAKINCLGFHHF